MIVDPSTKQTEKEKWMEQSLIRSHASARAHRHKRSQEERTKKSRSKRASTVKSDNQHNEQLQMKPKFSTSIIQVQPNSHFGELRSLQFFRERTATEWSLWYDVDFCQVLALQAAASNASVRHALASIGAIHESMTICSDDERRRFRQFSMVQCKKALSSLIRDYDRMSVSAILTTYVAIATITGFTDGSTYLQAVQAQFDILDNLRQRPDQTTPSDWSYISQYIEPSIERQRSENGQYVDLLWCLRATPAALFYEAEPIDLPQQFTSMNEARMCLDKVLNCATYEVKSGHQVPGQIPETAENRFNMWLEALDRFEAARRLDSNDDLASCSHSRTNSTTMGACATRREKLTLALLKISAKLSMLMIRTMDANSETVFDDYLPLYQEFANVFSTVLEFKATHSAPSCFHLSSSLFRLVGNAASRWCRDPTTRRQLISLLYRAQSLNTPEGAIVWAEYCRCTMLLEERGLPTPPKSAADIPVENRVLIHFASFYHNYWIRHVRFHIWPYGETDFKDFYISKLGSGEYHEDWPDGVDLDAKPSLIIGRGFMSWLNPTGPDEYYTVKNPRFYFTIPKV